MWHANKSNPINPHKYKTLYTHWKRGRKKTLTHYYALSFWQACGGGKKVWMLQALLGETCRLTSAFSDRQPWLAHRGEEGNRWGGRQWSEGSSGLVVNSFGGMTPAFPFIGTKEGRGEDGSDVSVESPESCRFSGFRLWLSSLQSSLSVSLSATADCVICINESWKREMVIPFPRFSLSPFQHLNQSF